MSRPNFSSAGATLTQVGSNDVRFSWTPDPSQGSLAGKVNAVTVLVTDDGSPQMSAQQTFNITVSGHVPPVLSVANADLIGTLNDDGSYAPVATQVGVTDPNSDAALDAPYHYVIENPSGDSAIDQSGDFTYTPTHDDAWTARLFQISVTDATGAASVATVHVRAEIGSDDPGNESSDFDVTPADTSSPSRKLTLGHAIDDTFTVYRNDPSSMNLNVYANDLQGTFLPDQPGTVDRIDPNLIDPNTASTITEPTTRGGSVTTDNALGTWQYTPPAGFIGEDQFTYTLYTWDLSIPALVTDNTATVKIEVKSRPPVANNDSFSGVLGQAISGNVSSNDSDPNGSPLTDTLTDQSGNPISPPPGMNWQSNGNFTYTPDFAGKDNLTLGYKASDGLGTAFALISFKRVNRPPVANPDIYTVVAHPSGKSVLLDGVLSNDTDPDNDTISLASVDPHSAAGATLSIQGNDIKYKFGSAPFTGIDTFKYRISDGNGGTAEGTVSVYVIDVQLISYSYNTDGSSPAGTGIVDITRSGTLSTSFKLSAEKFFWETPALEPTTIGAGTPVWQAGGITQPIAFVRNSTLVVDPKLLITGKIPFDYTLHIDGGSRVVAGADITITPADLASGTTTKTAALTLKSLPNTVAQWSISFDWKASLNGSSKTLGSTTTSAYVLYAKPEMAGEPSGLLVTAKRVQWITKVAANLDDRKAIIAAIGRVTATNRLDYSHNLNTMQNSWNILDTSSRGGDCQAETTLMKQALNMLGVGGVSVVYVYPVTDDPRLAPGAGTTPGWNIGGNIGPWSTSSGANQMYNGLKLGYYTNPTNAADPGWNNYEACLVAVYDTGGGALVGDWWQGGESAPAGQFAQQPKAAQAAYNVLMYQTSPNNAPGSKHQALEGQRTKVRPYPTAPFNPGP